MSLSVPASRSATAMPSCCRNFRMPRAASAATAAKAAADVAAAAYKAEYNALAKKWNAKNPKAKVALKK